MPLLRRLWIASVVLFLALASRPASADEPDWHTTIKTLAQLLEKEQADHEGLEVRVSVDRTAGTLAVLTTDPIVEKYNKRAGLGLGDSVPQVIDLRVLASPKATLAVRQPGIPKDGSPNIRSLELDGGKSSGLCVIPASTGGLVPQPEQRRDGISFTFQSEDAAEKALKAFKRAAELVGAVEADPQVDKPGVEARPPGGVDFLAARRQQLARDISAQRNTVSQLERSLDTATRNLDRLNTEFRKQTDLLRTETSDAKRAAIRAAQVVTAAQSLDAAKVKGDTEAALRNARVRLDQLNRDLGTSRDGREVPRSRHFRRADLSAGRGAVHCSNPKPYAITVGRGARRRRDTDSTPGPAGIPRRHRGTSYHTRGRGAADPTHTQAARSGTRLHGDHEGTKDGPDPQVPPV